MTTNNTTIEAINEDYEWLQYNEQLRIIHSINDDMFQLQSIVTACQSNKPARHWLENQNTKELLDEFNKIVTVGIPTVVKRDDLPNGLRGYYVHRLLVNSVAMWASPKYSIHIMRLLDNYFEQQRQQQETKIQELLPRAVPKDHKYDYRYLIWKETIPNNNEFVKLHLVRRNKHNFRAVSKHFHNEEERWYYKDKLPISMSPNVDIKEIIKNNFGENDVRVYGFVITIRVTCLPRLYELIDNYFTNMQV